MTPQTFLVRIRFGSTAPGWLLRQNRIDGVEHFRNQVERHLRRFNGFPEGTFRLFLKGWRFSGGGRKRLLNQLKQWTKRRL